LILVTLLLASASPQEVVDAERAFAARAQTEGLWTAFRATAADDGLLFVPGPTNARQWLKDRKDPLIGYMWWPAEGYVSCDGSIGATTGPSVLGASRGYFSTIWVRQSGGEWKWVFDHGDTLEQPRSAGERPKLRTASCANKRGRRPIVTAASGGGGSSADGTFIWTWEAGGAGAQRRLTVQLWNGKGYDWVLEDPVGGGK
jgi:hypothetical protein